MFFGAHVLLYSGDADADRIFLRDVLGFEGVDAGHGWLILGLPPTEVAVHPRESEDNSGGLGGVLYLMCENLSDTMAALQAKDVVCTGVEEERWGIRSSVVMPSGAELGIYQPKHPVAIPSPK